MNLHSKLIILVLLWAGGACAQSRTTYIHPEYKIRLRDTVGTYVQLINYFDRSYYLHDIYLRQMHANGGWVYHKIPVDTSTGISVVPANTNFQVQIGKVLELRNVIFKKDKVTRIEIRNEGGFVALPVKWGKAPYKEITATFLYTYDSTLSNTTLPTAMELPQGKYNLSLNTLPEIRRTIYLKPSRILYFPIHKPVPFKMVCKKTNMEFKLFYAEYPDKKFVLCKKGDLKDGMLPIYLQPKKIYQLQYRKKGRKRYSKKRFYIAPNMELFILSLD